MIDPQLGDDAPVVTPRMLRQFAALTIVLSVAVAGWSLGIVHRGGLRVWVASAAAIVGLAGLIRPEWIRPLFSALMAVVTPVGLVVSKILLAVLFFGVFTPLGWVFRVLRRDALQLKRPARTSDWVARPAVTDLRSYTRQS